MSNTRAAMDDGIADFATNERAFVLGLVNQVKYIGQIQRGGAWESMKGRPCLVQQSLESVKRGSIDPFDREFILRCGMPHREGCFPPE